MVDELTAEAIRRAWYNDGELSSIVEFQRHYPVIKDHAAALRCVQAIVGWAPPPAAAPESG